MYDVIMNKEKIIITGPKNGDLFNFFEDFKKNYPEFLMKNIIVDLSSIQVDKISDVRIFMDIAMEHLENSTSFVIIVSGIDIDELPDELVIVPTMVEALDIIEMDEITRDLGF